MGGFVYPTSLSSYSDLQLGMTLLLKLFEGHNNLLGLLEYCTHSESGKSVDLAIHDYRNVGNCMSRIAYIEVRKQVLEAVRSALQSKP